MIKHFLKSKWPYATIHIVGFGVLAGYVLLVDDWSFSILWALAFPAIAFFVSWLIVSLNLPRRFPTLNHHLLFPSNSQVATTALSDDEWALEQAKYLESGMPKASILFAASEDGLVCVPVLMAGIGPISTLVGGLAFGLFHLGRFTYLECAAKSIYYALVCLLVLPHGLLTVVIGHLMMDFFALVVVKAAKHDLTRKLRSNLPAKNDASP